MCSMMSEIPLKKSLNTISYQISEKIENILLNKKGEPKLDATVKWYHIKKQQQQQNTPLQCLSASLTHPTGRKNYVLQGLHWVDGHSVFTGNKTIKPTCSFHTGYDHRISRASHTNRDNIFHLL